MKKKTLSRALDLTSSIPELDSETAEYLVRDLAGYLTDYNGIMAEYEAGKASLAYLFMLVGTTDPGVFQHLPLFCWHYQIEPFRIVERFPTKRKETLPFLIGVRKDDQRIGTIKSMIEKNVGKPK